MTASPLRFGVAGLGFGVRVHIPVLRSLPSVEVVAIAGSSPDKTGETARRLGIPVACAGYEQLMDQNLDAVTLALPPDQNEIAVRRALEKGLAVLSEKPLALSGAVAAQLAGMAVNHTTMVDFEFAELSVFRNLKEIILDQRYGMVRAVKIEWKVASWAQKNRVWSWKTDALRGGGVISLLGSHMLYLLEWLFGPIERLTASTESRKTQAFAPPGAVAADDTASMSFHHAGGLLSSATIGNAGSEESGHRWEIEFDKAAAVLYNPGPDYISGFSLTLRTPDGKTFLAAQEDSRVEDGRVPAFRAMAGRFVEAVRKRHGVQPDLSAGARVQILMDAVHASALRSQPVEVRPS